MAVSSEAEVARAKQVFRRYGGVLRTKDAIIAGVQPRALYQMRDDGTLERLARGLYRLAEFPPMTVPDLATVALKIRDGVICLVSALAFHEITTQIPRAISVAVPWHTEPPRLSHPPIKVYYFGRKHFNEGVQKHDLDSIPVRVYSQERTLADCFKYRRKIGMDVVLEALDLYAENRRADIDSLLHYARICRVENVMRPYLEVMLRHSVTGALSKLYP